MRRRLRWSGAVGTIALHLMLGVPAVQAQQMTVSGRVTYNPSMTECADRAICERDIALGLHPDNEWEPPTAAVNIAVLGTDQVVKTDRDGNYAVTVPSPDASLMFMFIGYSRVEVPVQGRTVVDVRLTPQPQAEITRVLDIIMPDIHAMRTPDIDQVAQQTGLNRETVRDIVWLTYGNVPFRRTYPNEYMPDYRFADADDLNTD